MNSVNLMGRLVNEPEIRLTATQKKFISFRVAVDGGKDKDGNKITYFLPCVAWNGTAENIAKFFHKGERIGVSGIITSRDYEDQDGKKRTLIEILVNSFDFCNEKKKEDQDEKIGEVPFEL